MNVIASRFPNILKPVTEFDLCGWVGQACAAASTRLHSAAPSSTRSRPATPVSTSWRRLPSQDQHRPASAQHRRPTAR